MHQCSSSSINGNNVCPATSLPYSSPQSLKRAVCRFADLMGLVSFAAESSDGQVATRGRTNTNNNGGAGRRVGPLAGDAPAAVADDALEAIIRTYFSHDAATADRLRVSQCKGLARTVGHAVERLAKAAEDALLLEREEEGEGGLCNADDKQLPPMDIHVKFFPQPLTSAENNPSSSSSPSQSQWIASVTLRDQSALRVCNGRLYVDAFINEGRVGGALVDYHHHNTHHRDGQNNGGASSPSSAANGGSSSSSSSSSSGSDLCADGQSVLITALHHLRRAEGTARQEAEAQRLQRLQDAADARKMAAASGGTTSAATLMLMRRKKAVGLDFLGDDGEDPTAEFKKKRGGGHAEGGEGVGGDSQQSDVKSPTTPASPAAAFPWPSSPSPSSSLTAQQQQHNAGLLRRITSTFISRCVLRCDTSHLPLWNDVRLAMEEALMGGGIGGTDTPCPAFDGVSAAADGSASVSSPRLSVRDGAVKALELIWNAREAKKKGMTDDAHHRRSRHTISCSFDLSQPPPPPPSVTGAAEGPSSQLATTGKRPRDVAAAVPQLPEFPPAIADSGIIAVFLCDAQTGVMVRSTKRGGGLRHQQPRPVQQRPQQESMNVPATVGADTPLPPLPSVRVVHFMVNDDGRNRVDFVNALI